MNNSKVWLVTGASGLLGNNLVNYLFNNNRRVVGICNNNMVDESRTIIEKRDLTKLEEVLILTP